MQSNTPSPSSAAYNLLSPPYDNSNASPNPHDTSTTLNNNATTSPSADSTTLPTLLPRLHPRLPLSIPLLPLIAAVTWFVTVLTLLIYWLADGRPHLPSMSREQRIAYISDVGAGRLKGLFITGGAVTGLCFVGGLVAERWGRHRGRLLPNMKPREKVMSVLSIISAIVGSAGLVLLAVFDTVQYETTHRVFLLVFMMGVSLSAVFTVTEYRYLNRAYASHALTRHLRTAYLLKAVITTILILLAIIFATFLFISGPEPADPADSTPEEDDRRGERQSVAAVFEWAVAFGYTAYLASGWYDLRGPPGIVGRKGVVGEKPEKGKEGV